MDNQGINHQRKIYNLLDLLGDLGGVTEVIMICFGIFIYPISEHSFVIKALKKVYMAKTNDRDLFEDKYAKEEFRKKFCGVDPKFIPEHLKEELDAHRSIHVNFN